MSLRRKKKKKGEEDVIVAEVVEDTALPPLLVSPEIVEKTVDRMFLATGSEIRKRWKEKYGEEFTPPEYVVRPSKLYLIRAKPAKEVPEALEKVAGAKPAVEAGEKEKRLEARKPVSPNIKQILGLGREAAKPWYALLNFSLLRGKLKLKLKVLRFIFLIIDIVLWALLLVPRLFITAIMIVVTIARRGKKTVAAPRRAEEKAEKKAKRAKKMAEERAEEKAEKKAEKNVVEMAKKAKSVLMLRRKKAEKSVKEPAKA